MNVYQDRKGKSKPTFQSMPASVGSNKESTSITGALKWKQSKVIKTILPKKKRKGPTNNVSSASISPKETTIELSSNVSTIDSDTDTGNDKPMVEDGNAELGTSFIPVFR
jgi:hypothetical protein